MSVAHERLNRIPKEERRLQILDAATDLFARQGFADTTMDDIAAAANITKRTLYRYIATKEQLLYDLHSEFVDVGLALNTEGIEGDAAAQVAEIIRRHVAVVTAYRRRIAVFFDDRKHLPPEQQREITSRRGAYEHILVNAIREGQEHGDFRPCDARVAARAIFGSLTESYRWYNPDGDRTAAHIAHTAERLFIKGLRVGPLDQSTVTEAIAAGKAVHRPMAPASTPAERVRAAAIESFARVGYRNSSIRDLADIAKLTTGAVMYHAGDKHSLLDGAISSVMTDGIEDLRNVRASGGEPPAMLAKLVAAHLIFLAERNQEIAVANENLGYLEPEAYERIVGLRREWGGFFETTINEGIRSGDFADLDPLITRHIVIGLMNSTYRWYREGGILTPEDLAAEYLALLLNGLNAT